jgi:hypothetical protein
VEARIEIVWPHDNQPVSQATLANVTAILLNPGTMMSAPLETNATVRLWRSLDNGVGVEMGAGTKRTVVSPQGLPYPVWDFSNVDVSTARDPNHKLTFRLTVDGMQTFSNIWVHGVDARTIFPQMDTPSGVCQ